MTYRVQPKQRILQVGQRLQRAVEPFDMRRIRHAQSVTCHSAVSTCYLPGHVTVDDCGNDPLTRCQSVIADNRVDRSERRFLGGEEEQDG